MKIFELVQAFLTDGQFYRSPCHQMAGRVAAWFNEWANVIPPAVKSADASMASARKSLNFLPTRSGGHPDVAYLLGLGTARTAYALWADDNSEQLEAEVDVKLAEWLAENGPVDTQEENQHRMVIQTVVRTRAFKEQPADVQERYRKLSKESKTKVPVTDVEK